MLELRFFPLVYNGLIHAPIANTIFDEQVFHVEATSHGHLYARLVSLSVHLSETLLKWTDYVYDFINRHWYISIRSEKSNQESWQGLPHSDSNVVSCVCDFRVQAL